MDRRKVSIRELETLAGEHVMGLRIVSRDWPCEYECECGEYEAITYFRNGITPETVSCEERGPVYTEVPEGMDWFWKASEDGTHMANLDPVPFYACNANATREIKNQLLAEGYKWTVHQVPGYPAEVRFISSGPVHNFWGKHADELIATCIASLATKDIHVEVDDGQA